MKKTSLIIMLGTIASGFLWMGYTSAKYFVKRSVKPKKLKNTTQEKVKSSYKRREPSKVVDFKRLEYYLMEVIRRTYLPNQGFTSFEVAETIQIIKAKEGAKSLPVVALGNLMPKQIGLLLMYLSKERLIHKKEKNGTPLRTNRGYVWEYNNF